MKIIKKLLITSFLCASVFLIGSCDKNSAKSAYQLAVDAGYNGTEEEWLASLKGKDGTDGINGKNGTNGTNGKSAYEIAVENGFEGTEEEWLNSLKGTSGENGRGITSTEIDSNGDLIITYTDGEVVNAGHLIDYKKVINSGKCGENVIWTYYSDNSLVISGTGAMYEYYDGYYYEISNIAIPWYSYSELANKIIVEEGVTSICRFAFLDARLCSEISIADTVTNIGECAFEHMKSITRVVLPENLKTIEDGLFLGASSLRKIIIPASLTSIGKTAFDETALIYLYFKGTKAQSAEINGYNDIPEEANWYYFTENKEAETESGNWWYFDEEGRIQIVRVE